MGLKGWGSAHASGIKRAAWVLVGIALLYVLAWLAVPPVLRAQIEKQGSEALGRRVSVAQVEFKPWSLELTLRGLALANATGGAPQVQIERIYVNAAVQSLWRLAPVLDALQVDAPALRFAQTAPGQFDFDDVLERLAARPSEPGGKPARFALYNLQLQGGSVDFDDRTVNVRHALRGLTLSLPFLSNLATDREVTVTPKLAFELDGSAFESSAESTPFTESRQTRARLQIRDFDLAPLAAYVPPSLAVKLRAATLNADLGLDFSDQAETPKVSATGNAQLANVALNGQDDQPLLTFDALKVTLADVRPLEREVNLGDVEWVAPHVFLRRDASGAVALPGVGEGASPAATQAQDMAAAPPWKVSVQNVRLSDGSADWRDDSLPNTAGGREWQARDWQAQVTDLAWPLQQPLHFRSSLRLGGGDAGDATAQIEAEGEATQQQVKATVSAGAVSLALAAPYLANVLKPKLAGTIDAKLQVQRDGEALSARLERLALTGASLSCAGHRPCPTLRDAGMARAGKGEQLALRQLEVTDAQLDLQRRRVALGHVVLDAPQALVARGASGAWVFDDWLKTPDVPEPASATESAAWDVAVGEVQLKGGALALRDAATASPVALDLSAIDLRARDVTLRDGRLPAFGLRLQTRVGAGGADPGSLAWDGTVALAPALQAKGKVRAFNLPLQALQAYVASDLNVDVVRADGDFTGDVSVTDGKGGLSVGVQGDAALDDLHVRVGSADSAGAKAPATSTVGERGEDLLRWKTLALNGLALSMTPDKPLALEVRQTALTDFFARVIVQENGRINLQDIGKASVTDDATQPAKAPESAAPAAAPQIRFGPVALTNGTVDFTDHFIKPNYSANLTQLTGSLSAFSSEQSAPGASPQMAQLELKGRAQGTATLEISGELNPLAQPLALDIQGHMRDLELPPLSPYSVKYSGHGIERGKLSMDVAYKVQPDGQLTASNKLVLKQLAFGDEVKGAPASLPVRLAVALLADRNGVIDIDLPISGSLNDPDFSLGPVILKVIGNLIMKAITAPFSLLASALGGGDEQGTVDFAPGSSALGTKAREQLDAIAKALAERPALKATVTGWADAATERDGWKRARLREMLLAEKRREAVQAGRDAVAVTEVPEQESAALLKRVYQRADDIKKPRNLIGIAKDLPPTEMEQLLLASIAVPDGAMQELALARSVAVRDYLAAHEVPMDRLFVGASKLEQPGKEAKPFAPRAQLELSPS